MLIPLSLVETKPLYWRGFQAWFGFTKFQPTIVLQQLQSHKQSSHWNVFTSTVETTAFFSLFRMFQRTHQQKAQNCHDFLQSGYRIRWRGGRLMAHTFVFERIPTKHRTAKSKSGRAERMRSHRQPRVGITNTARRTSNTVPMAQKTCQREKKQSQMRIRVLLRPLSL